MRRAECPSHEGFRAEEDEDQRVTS
jgi:hypothetical protein